VPPIFFVVLGVFLSIYLFSGCSTPPDVREAHALEAQAAGRYRDDMRALAKAAIDDLALAWQKLLVQAMERGILDSRDVDGKVSTEDLLRLLNGEDGQPGFIQSLLDIAKKKEEIFRKVDKADINWDIFSELHDMTSEFLNRTEISEEEKKRILSATSKLAEKLATRGD